MQRSGIKLPVKLFARRQIRVNYSSKFLDINALPAIIIQNMKGGEIMKKTLLFALAMVFALTAVSSAAILKAPKDVAKSAAISGDSGKMGVGFSGGTPTLRYNFSDDSSGQLGIGFTSSAGSSVFSLLLAGDKDVMVISGNTVNMGGVFTTTSGAGSSWTAAFTCGVETKLNQSLVLELKVWPISYTSIGNTSIFSLLNTATVGAHIYL